MVLINFILIFLSNENVIFFLHQMLKEIVPEKYPKKRFLNIFLFVSFSGFPGLANLISALSDNFVVRGRGPKKMICIAQPGKIFNNSKDMYQVQR